MGDFLIIKLIDAAMNDDMEELEFCLNIGDIDVNALNDSGVTALTAACSQGNFACVDRLLQHPKIDVNKPGRDKKSPLFICAQKGKKSLVLKLIAVAEIDVNTCDKNGNTCFMSAMRARHDEILAILLRHPNLDINQQNKDGINALMLASTLGHTNIVKELLYRVDTDINLKNKKNQTARDIAEKKKSKGIVNAFDEYKRKMESRKSSVRGRVFSTNAKLREYQASFDRGGSFLSNLSDEEFKKSTKNGGDVLSTLIRMQGAGPTKESKSEVDDLKSRLKPKRDARESTDAADDNKKKSSVGATTKPLASKVKEEKEKNTKKSLDDKPHYATEFGKVLVEASLPELCEIFYTNHVKTNFVASKLTESELTHNVGLKGKQLDAVRELINKISSSASPPERMYDVSFLSADEPTILSRAELSEMKTALVSGTAIKEVFDEVEHCSVLAVIINENDFLKEEKVIAAITWAYLQKIKVVGLNTSSNETSGIFKAAFRSGQSLLPESSWKAFQEVNITYPNVYDALESLSKNVATSDENFIAKILSVQS